MLVANVTERASVERSAIIGLGKKNNEIRLISTLSIFLAQGRGMSWEQQSLDEVLEEVCFIRKCYSLFSISTRSSTNAGSANQRSRSSTMIRRITLCESSGLIHAAVGACALKKSGTPATYVMSVERSSPALAMPSPSVIRVFMTTPG